MAFVGPGVDHDFEGDSSDREMHRNLQRLQNEILKFQATNLKGSRE